MLTKVKIENYQSIKSAELEFVPGVNVIIGDPSSGKTAIQRAILWVKNYRPLGNSFHSHFASETEPTRVIISTDNGKDVSLQKAKSAFYEVSVKDSVVESYKSFGSSVPDLVEQALNLTSLNVQEQLDQHFLITSTPGEVAREFNKIIRIEEVDKWLSKLTSKINSENSDIKQLTKQLEDKSNELKDLEFLDTLEPLLVEIEKLTDRVASLSLEEQTLSSIVDEMGRLETEFNKLSLFVQRCSGLVEQFLTLHSQYKELDSIDVLLSDFITQVETYTDEVEFSKFIIPYLKEIDQLEQLLIGLKNEEIIISSIVDQVSSKTELLQDWQKNKNQNVQELSNTLRLLGKCPTCFSVITDTKLKEIITNL